MAAEAVGDKPAILSETVRLPEFAKRYKVSLTTVYNWLDDGLPSFKIGRQHLTHVPTADRWIEAKFTGRAFETTTMV